MADKDGLTQADTVDAASVPAVDVLDESVQPVQPDELRYETLETLGTGGMGEVLLVRDHHIGRDIALKQLKTEIASTPESRRRFSREARLQGQLEHPAIVPVYDLGTSPEGAPFFTMKRVRGTSLASVIFARKQGTRKYSLRRVLSAFSQVCLAAHYAHERGVVHRDLKPANIMLGDYGEVYILDWGVAKVGVEQYASARPRTHEPTESRLLTREGDLIGTLVYMAPEQARGEHHNITSATDVYALGAILFEIVTGTRLHDTDDEDMLERILSGVEARPSVRCPGTDVPLELEEICVAATRLDPHERLPSARAMHEAIEAYLDGDRELERRRENASAHTNAANAAAKIALDGEATPDEATRQRGIALREVGRALALDPKNNSALTALVQLLTKPPREIPPEVDEEREQTWKRQIRRGAIAGFGIYMYVWINVALTAFDSNDVDAQLIALAIWGGAVLASIATMVWRSYVGLIAMFVFGVTASTLVSEFFSPHILVPAFLTMHAVLYCLVRQWWVRIFVIGMAVAGWTVAVFGERVGWFSRSVHFVNGGIVIETPMKLAGGFTSGYLYAAILAVIILPALVVSFLRNSYHKADLQTRLQAWQLQQLVRDE